MNTDTKPPARRRSWRRRAVHFLVGFVVTLIVGKAFESVTREETIRSAYAVQERWIGAVQAMSPLGLAGAFIGETAAAWRGQAPDPDHYYPNATRGAGALSPLVGLMRTIGRAWSAGAFFAVIQIVLGGLAFAAFNMARSKGKRALLGFGEDSAILHMLVTPVAIIGAASLIALALQILMFAALSALHWFTGLAAAAAGATGVAGFCWYCVSKLGEKGAEHALTPKL